jgi:hypothetical protein
MDVAANMTSYIGRDGVVSNPVQPEENFADRWGSEPRRAAKFFAWVDDLQETLEAARASQGGIPDPAAKLQARFRGRADHQICRPIRRSPPGPTATAAH